MPRLLSAFVICQAGQMTRASVGALTEGNTRVPQGPDLQVGSRRPAESVREQRARSGSVSAFRFCTFVAVHRVRDSEE